MILLTRHGSFIAAGTIWLAFIVLPACTQHGQANLVGYGCGDSDGGPCTADSQCQSGSYCDYSITVCPQDAGSPYQISVVVPGGCKVACSNGKGCLGPCGQCQVGEDCAPTATCEETSICTIEQPCDAGQCVTVTGAVPSCPVGCKIVNWPHRPGNYCVCPGNACNAPLVDGGS